MTALCVTCDKPAGTCDHDGHSYLPPVNYEPVTMEDGRTAWKVPDGERWRFDHPPSSWAHVRHFDDERERAQAGPDDFGPVTTAAGENMRQLALRVLQPRFDVLVQRAKRRTLTANELREAGELEKALALIESMCPAEPTAADETGALWVLDPVDLASTASERHYAETGHALREGCCVDPVNRPPLFQEDQSNEV